MSNELDPELAHLAPSFDPSSLTIPKLRGILVQHDVNYPASAKKGQLVDIFNHQVAPQAAKILRERAKVKRSTRGIEHVPSSQESNIDEDDELVAKTPRRVHRKSAKADADESQEDATLPPKSTSKRGRTTSSKARAGSAIDEGGSHIADRDGDRSRKTPTSNPVPDFAGDRNDGTPFSTDNPFQSGSSPISGSRSPSGERRRRTEGPTESKSRRRATSGRRKTDFAAHPQLANGGTTTVSQKMEFPLGNVKHGQVTSTGNDVLAGEEFTAEEEQALALAESRTGRRAPPSSTHRSRPASLFMSAIWSIALVIVVAVALVWREEKLRVGFCGIGRPSETFGGVDLDERLDNFRPQCEPCPPHATCYQRLEASCEAGFVLTQHPLALQGLVPLPPSCEPDGERARKVKAVADRALEELRERNARFECGELRDGSGKLLAHPEVGESELKEKVATGRRRGMTNEEFESLWQPALGDLSSRSEVVSGTDGKSGRRTLRSTSLARISLGCAARRSVRLAVARHLWKVGALIALVIGAGYARIAISNARGMEATAKQLASAALDRLATQASLHAQDAQRFPESWISMGQLRDDVLREEFSAKRRQKLWDRVQKKVEDNSNVRSMIREVKSGEVARVWEWIGVLAEGQQKRVSFGPGAKPESTDGSWTERPIY